MQSVCSETFPEQLISLVSIKTPFPDVYTDVLRLSCFQANQYATKLIRR